jgi:hypothetical protein
VVIKNYNNFTNFKQKWLHGWEGKKEDKYNPVQKWVSKANQKRLKLKCYNKNMSERNNKKAIKFVKKKENWICNKTNSNQYKSNKKNKKVKENNLKERNRKLHKIKYRSKNRNWKRSYEISKSMIISITKENIYYTYIKINLGRAKKNFIAPPFIKRILTSTTTAITKTTTTKTAAAK